MVRHGGMVSLESEEGEGSVFALHFPLEIDRDHPPEDMAELDELGEVQ